MKVIIINIIFLLSLVNLFKCLPSDNIWYQLKTSIEENKIILNDNNGHFIYDESNYKWKFYIKNKKNYSLNII